MPESDAVDKRLRRLLLALTAVLVCLLCFFVWRLSMLAYRIEQSVAAMAADIKQITATGARLSVQVDELTGRLTSLEDTATEMVRGEELTDFLAQVASLPETWGGGDANIDAQAAAEIAHLVKCIGHPDLEYEYAGKRRSAAWVHLKLYNKYRLYRAAITSAEDFIDKVATRTVAGNDYYVMDKDGQEARLGEWLIERLRQYRSSNPRHDSADDNERTTVNDSATDVHVQ